MGVSQVIPYVLIVVCPLFVSSDSNLTLPVTKTTNVASEGGPVDTTHMGREHMIKVNHTNLTTKVPAFEVGQKNDNKTSVPKKDATLNDTHSSSTTTTSTTTTTTTKTTTTTTTLAPHKPTLTIGEDEEPSNSEKTKTNDTHNHGITIEAVVEKPKKTDYVVPIVAVILSVPIVAIVFSVLYKRGSDWWQHRHYRRMDFLIEGMYNN